MQLHYLLVIVFVSKRMHCALFGCCSFVISKLPVVRYCNYYTVSCV